MYFFNMTEEHPSLAKRKKIFTAVAQDIVTSEDDDHVADGMDMCSVIENEIEHRSETTSALHALGKTLRNTLLEINNIREQNRERRHRELLQTLAKITQEENATKNVDKISTKLNTDIVNNQEHISTNEYVFVEPDCLQSGDISKSVEDGRNDCSTKTFRNNLNVVEFISKNHVDSANTAQNSSSKSIKLLPKSEITNKLAASKIKSVVAIKHDTKIEFQKMRAQMLELQREKMEDRERKKRELLRMQNM